MDLHDPHFCRNDAPDVRKRCLDLRRVKATEQLKVIILSPWISGFDTHWKEGHTEPCTKRTGVCQLCEHEWPYKWIGFLHCVEPSSNEQFFLELTDHAWKKAKLVKGAIPTFRGLRMCFSRERGNMKSPVSCVLLSDEPMENSRLIPPKEVEDSLKTAWKFFFRDRPKDVPPV